MHQRVLMRLGGRNQPRQNPGKIGMGNPRREQIWLQPNGAENRVGGEVGGNIRGCGMDAHQTSSDLRGESRVSIPIAQRRFPQCVAIRRQKPHRQHAINLPEQPRRHPRHRRLGKAHPPRLILVADHWRFPDSRHFQP